MRYPSWLRWYMRLLQQTAQPRDDAAVERGGVGRLLGSRRAGNGWGTVIWSSQVLVLALVVVASPVAGLWWFAFVVLPLLAHSVARTIGTYREGHFF